eukprot:Amastigsp_a860552_3.p2 type:complete len:126 gc:universal Amastigsp_a860552_3:99-476(+)
MPAASLSSAFTSTLIGVLYSRLPIFLSRMCSPSCCSNLRRSPSVNTPMRSPPSFTTVTHPNPYSVIFTMASFILVFAFTKGLILFMASFTRTVIRRVSVRNCSVPMVVKLFSVNAFRIFSGTVMV